MVRTSVRRTFVVNTYETRWVPNGSRAELPVCSGFDQGSPAGVLRQTFRVYGLRGDKIPAQTISEIGIVNTEQFKGEIAILRGDTVLFSRSIEALGSPEFGAPPFVTSKVGLRDLPPGDVLTLQLTITEPTAKKPNWAINFARSTSDAAAGSATTVNSCPWNPPSPPAGTDLIGWIAP